jgi:hypothetical protein
MVSLKLVCIAASSNLNARYLVFSLGKEYRCYTLRSNVEMDGSNMASGWRKMRELLSRFKSDATWDPARYSSNQTILIPSDRGVRRRTFTVGQLYDDESKDFKESLQSYVEVARTASSPVYVYRPSA